MINKQFKFEGKIPKGYTGTAVLKKLKPKFWRFQGQYDLKDQGQGHQLNKLTCSQGMTQLMSATKMRPISPIVLFYIFSDTDRSTLCITWCIACNEEPR